MIEITLTEMALFVWAGLATASWLNSREEARVARKMLLLFIENKEAREQVLKAHEQFVRNNGGEG